MNPEFLFIFERITGIEPVSLDWQPRVITIILYPLKESGLRNTSRPESFVVIIFIVLQLYGFRYENSKF